jgi:FkbM family methyltransferase
MTPKLTIRTFSNDQYVLDKVFYSNFYRIKGFSEADRKPVIADFGAHCGYFCFASLSLGAKKVYAFEPFTPNYKVLLDNVFDNPIAQVIPYQLGVYVAPVSLTFGYPQLINKSYFDFSSVGMDTNVESVEFCKCCVLPLDTLLEQYIGEQVDIMKLSIGYAEMAIISASELIKDRVHNLCGEITLDEQGQNKFKSILGLKGFIDTKFYPVEGEENKILFHSSKTNVKEMFN